MTGSQKLLAHRSEPLDEDPGPEERAGNRAGIVLAIVGALLMALGLLGGGGAIL